MKATSEDTYAKNWCEFWRTMRRLKIPDAMVWDLPLSDVILQIYVIDCCFIRTRKNVYETVRNKLRSLDFVAQLCGLQQSWSTNPALMALIKYVRKRHPGKGSNTLPVTARLLLQIVQYIMTFKVYYGLVMNTHEIALAKQWLSFAQIWHDKQRLVWYMFALSLLFVGVLGLRGAECYQNGNKAYKGYGVYLRDLTMFWQRDGARTLYTSNAYSRAYDNLHHVRIRLRHSKSARLGSDVFLRVGRTNKRIDPAILLYHLYHLQRRELRRIYKYKLLNRYLFQVQGVDCTLTRIKKTWSKVVHAMGFLEAERYRFHGLRKGFATTLLQNGVPTSLIAFAGRWKLTAAIYRYIIHTQYELIGLADTYLYGSPVSGEQVDMDGAECDLVKALPHMKATVSSDFLKKFQSSLQAPDVILI